MQTIADEIVANGISRTNIIYIDLDKRGFRKIKEADQLELLIDEKSKNIDGLKYLFIDEVQNISDF